MYETPFSSLTAFLGADRPRGAQLEDEGEVPSGRDVIAERLAHAEGLGPEPEADPIPPNHPLLTGALIPPE